MTTVLTQIARSFQAWQNCVELENEEWKARHQEKIEELCENRLPSGSGFDAGVLLDFDTSRTDRLVFVTSFHHMDDGGGYCGRSDHNVIVKPSLAFGYTLRVTGKNVDWIKPYIGDTFAEAFDQSAEEDFYKACNHKSMCNLFSAACGLVRKQIGFTEFKSTLNQAY